MRLWRRRRAFSLRDWEKITLQDDIARLEWELGISDEPPPSLLGSSLNHTEYVRRYERLKRGRQMWIPAPDTSGSPIESQVVEIANRESE